MTECDSSISTMYTITTGHSVMAKRIGDRQLLNSMILQEKTNYRSVLKTLIALK